MVLLILYGSETGTAQDTAECLRREAELRRLKVRVQGLDEYDVDCLPEERAVLFVVSTTGQGEMPPNMRSAWRMLLRRSLSSTFLSNVRTAVIGLGDSSYLKYNYAGKKIYRRLVQLGATMLTDLGLADDQHEIGIDGALIPWKTNMFNSLFESNLFPDMTQEPDNTVVLKPRYRIVDHIQNDVPMKNGYSQEEKQDYTSLRVDFNKRVTSEDHFQETRLVRFLIAPEQRESMRYNAGDVLMIRPYNTDETMEIAIEALGYTSDVLDRPVRIERNNEFVKLPPMYMLGEKPTLRTCLHRYLDLQQIPKRSFFEVLSYISTDPMEKERLAELGKPEGLDDLIDYCTRPRRTIAETLRDFPATAKNIHIDQLFELLTPIRPRAFSIASGPNEDHIELLVAKVEYKSRMAEKRRGLCSTYISRLAEGDLAFCKVRAGTFKFPSVERPAICIGPGTGVAPFRSFFYARNQKSNEKNGILFFGCRNADKDYYFGDEWPELECVDVITAFSRDSDRKVYVQHKIGEFAGRVWNVINKNGVVLVAGSSGDMPKAVTNVLNEIANSHGFEGNWVAKAETTGHIQYETWS